MRNPHHRKARDRLKGERHAHKGDVRDKNDAHRARDECHIAVAVCHEKEKRARKARSDDYGGAQHMQIFKQRERIHPEPPFNVAPDTRTAPPPPRTTGNQNGLDQNGLDQNGMSSSRSCEKPPLPPPELRPPPKSSGPPVS